MKSTMKLQAFFTDPIIHRSYKGNTDTITSCLFTPDMKQVVSGSEDGNVFVWNTKPNMRPFKFIGHKGGVNEVAINPLGTIIASASNDDTVRLWNNSMNGASQMIKGHTGPVRSVDFSLDSRLIVTGSNDKTIKIFSLSDKKFYSGFNGHNNWVRTVRFSPDARLLGSCSDDHTVKLWDVTKHNVVHTFIDHLEDVNVCRFSPDGTCLASGSVDKKIKVFDIRSARIIQHYDAHAASVTSLSYHPSGNYLLSCSMDSTIKIWDLKMGQILYTVHGHEGPICSTKFSPCGDYFCSGGTDSILMIWKSNVQSLDPSGIGAYSSSSQKAEETKDSFKAKKYVPPKTKKQQKPTGQTQQPLANPYHVMNQNFNQSQSFSNNSMGQMQSSNIFNKLPEEMTTTFEKLIQQLDIIAKTMKIMDLRIQSVENNVSAIYNQRKQNPYKINPHSHMDFYDPGQSGEEQEIRNQIEEYQDMNPDQYQGQGQDQQEYLDPNNPNNFNSSLKYFNESSGGNVFNQGKQDNIFYQEPMSSNNQLQQDYQPNMKQEDYQQEEIPQYDSNDNDKPIISQDDLQGKIPVEIFEDIGNHVEELNQAGMINIDDQTKPEQDQ